MAELTIDALLREARTSIDRLAPEDAHRASGAGALIIDTRCSDDRRRLGTIPWSVHVPLSVLYWRLDPTSGFDDPSLSDRGRQVILVCAHGFSSSLAAATLRQLGFALATDVVGGFEGWVTAGLPIDPVEGHGATAGDQP